ncbi:EAL domain-containing protein [bacterium LRH843]|nr:EAL domain-containing protein [bacterium LRH843]
MPHNLKNSPLKRFLLEVIIVFLCIALIFGVIQFILLKGQRDTQINREAMIIGESIKEGIKTNELASRALEKQINFKMIQTSKLIAEQLQSNSWEALTNSELERIRKQHTLSGITLFAKVEGEIKGVIATDSKELGFSFKEYGYEHVVDDLLNGKKPVLEGAYTETNIMATPVAQSGSHTDEPIFFKYVYYHPPEADYFINIYSEANEVYELKNDVGVNEWIKEFYKKSSIVKEIGVLNLRVIHDPSLEENLYPPLRKVEYGSYRYETKQDLQLLKEWQTPQEKNLIQKNADGEKIYKVFLPLDEDLIVYMSFDYKKMTQSIFNNSTLQLLSVLVSLIALFFLTVRFFKRIKQAEEKINFMAYHDELTGLPNRRKLKKKLASFTKQEQSFSLLFLDIDNFKFINDTFGHQCGDDLIKESSLRIKAVLKKGEFVSRVGGDEFIVVLPGYSKQDQIEQAADEILRAFVPSFHACGQEIFVKMSIGISLYPNEGGTIDELIQRADTAMYYAKKKGKNNFQLYSSHMKDSFTQKVLLESEIRRALSNGEFLLYYQPTINVETESIVGVEALIRWKHPDKGMISPLEFIPYAEESNLIIPIGEWVLQEAINQIEKWKALGIPPLQVGVNLSARQFFNENMLQDIQETLRRSNLSPGDLTLEITESTMMDNPETTIKTIKELKKSGIRIAMDDFGTGYSSLSYLMKIPIDILKIDRSFVKELSEEKGDHEILSTIVSLGKRLNLEVIAEGIETNEQLEAIRKYGCDLAQGYLFGKPLPPEEFEKLFQKEAEE